MEIGDLSLTKNRSFCKEVFAAVRLSGRADQDADFIGGDGLIHQWHVTILRAAEDRYALKLTRLEDVIKKEKGGVT